jgi:biotin synthase
VRKTNVTVCSGGIIGMGENAEDRAGMLVALSTLNPQDSSLLIILLLITWFKRLSNIVCHKFKF